MLEEIVGRIKHKKWVVGVGLALIGLLIGSRMIAAPLIQQIRLVEKDKEETRKKEPTLRSIVELKNRFEKNKEAFAQPKESTQIIEELNSLAVRSGFAIQSIVPEQPAKIGAGFEKLSVHIDAAGTYHELGEFVSQIESLKYLVKIAKVEMSTSRDAMGSPVQSRLANRQNTVRIGVSVNLFYPSKETAA